MEGHHSDPSARHATLGTAGGSRAAGRAGRGAGVVEYALLVALISLACLAALQVFGLTNGGSINDTTDSYASAVYG